MKSLSVKNLSLIKSKIILKDISFSLNTGDILAIIGPNGAGKSSLLNQIANFRYENNPAISLFEKPTNAWHSRLLAQRFSYLEQSIDLSFNLTVREVISMGRVPHDTGLKLDNDIINQAIKVFDIRNLSDRFYTYLSGGEKQRVQLARSFVQTWSSDIKDGNNKDLNNNEMTNQCVQLLDEPTSALDIEHKHALMEHIVDTSKHGKTFVIVLHDLSFAARYANKILVLKNGRQEAFGDATSVLNEPLLEKVFNRKMYIFKNPHSNQLLISS